MSIVNGVHVGVGLSPPGETTTNRRIPLIFLLSQSHFFSEEPFLVEINLPLK